MRTLIVEDNPEKSRAIGDAVEKLASSHADAVVYSDNLSDAVKVVTQSAFDLIIVDLMLPYLSDGQADSKAGVELLRHIRGNGVNEGATVLGVSSFPDEVDAFRSHFSKYGVLITTFDETGGWQSALQRIVAEIESREGRRESLDFMIFVALEKERLAVLNAGLTDHGNWASSGLNITSVSLDGDRELRGAVVKVRQMGVVASTLDVSIALTVFKCPLVCMSGICAGVAGNTSLGQIVVASPAWEYQAGKWSTNGFEIAPSQIPLRPLTRLAIEQEFADPTLLDVLEKGLDSEWTRPSRKVGPMLAPAASGSAVIADKSKLQHIEQQHRKVSAVDMETFGLYFGVHESPQFVPHFFSAKCVVDLADNRKGDDLHLYGCAVAARAAIHLIRVLSGTRSSATT